MYHHQYFHEMIDSQEKCKITSFLSKIYFSLSKYLKEMFLIESLRNAQIKIMRKNPQIHPMITYNPT